MTIYLHGGWYKPGPKGGLRTEVLDGAMDTAGMLYRAGMSPELVSRLALRVRSLVRLGDTVATAVGSQERAFIASRLESVAGDSAEIVSFVADCLDHITSYSELAAFYLHLVHITRMMQLLTLARLGPTAPGGGGAPSVASSDNGDGAVAVPRVRRAPARKRKVGAAAPKRRTVKSRGPATKTTKRPR